MVLELVAIWTLVIGAIIWFVRDEKQAQKAKLEARARHFATAPAYRHRETAQAEPAPLAPAITRRPAGLTDVQRKFLEEFAKSAPASGRAVSKA